MNTYYADIKNLESVYFEGFDRNRKFNPLLELKFKVVASNKLEYLDTVVIVGYDRVWNFLDVVCWNEPLPRSHFNDLLKHRFTEIQETSSSVIREIIMGGDTKVFAFSFWNCTEKTDSKYGSIYQVNTTAPEIVDGIVRVVPTLYDLAHNLIRKWGFKNDIKHEVFPITYNNRIRNLPCVVVESDYYDMDIHEYAYTAIYRIVLLPNGKVCYFNTLETKHVDVWGKHHNSTLVSSHPRPLEFREAVLEQRYLMDVTDHMITIDLEICMFPPSSLSTIEKYADNPIKLYRMLYADNSLHFVENRAPDANNSFYYFDSLASV
jgi:hypothetical protein